MPRGAARHEAHVGVGGDVEGEVVGAGGVEGDRAAGDIYGVGARARARAAGKRDGDRRRAGWNLHVQRVISVAAGERERADGAAPDEIGGRTTGGGVDEY